MSPYIPVHTNGHLFQQDMVSLATDGEIKALRVLDKWAHILARYGSTGNYWRDKWVSLCLLIFPFTLNLKPHISHAYGFSPEWTLLCILRANFVWHRFPHSSQVCLVALYNSSAWPYCAVSRVVQNIAVSAGADFNKPVFTPNELSENWDACTRFLIPMSEKMHIKI